MKINVIYWSGTGNTEMMAETISDEIKNQGNDVKLLKVDEASIDDVIEAEAVALGCPSMGNEVLEECDMEPFVESIEPHVKGKKVLLFGSYGWGDGQWMRDWQERMEAQGAVLIEEGLMINETPEEDGLEECRNYARKLTV